MINLVNMSDLGVFVFAVKKRLSGTADPLRDSPLMLLVTIARGDLGANSVRIFCDPHET